jgi:hypothetical protein
MPEPEIPRMRMTITRANAGGRNSWLRRAGWVFKLSATNLINFLSRNGGRGYNLFQARFQGV